MARRITQWMRRAVPAAFALAVLGSAPEASAVIAGGTTVPGARIGDATPPPNLYGFVARQDAPVLCTATLVRSDLLLTSSHCVAGARRDELRWTIGVLNLDRDAGPQICATGCGSHVVDITIQTNASRRLHRRAQMALVQFDPPVTSILPVKLASRADHKAWERKNQHFTQLGWGVVNKRRHCQLARRPIESRELRMATIRLERAVVSDPTRRGLSRTIAVNGSPQRGDSGGPVLVGDAEDGFTQVGVLQQCEREVGRADRYLFSRAYMIQDMVDTVPRVYASAADPALVGRWSGPLTQTPETTSRYSGTITLTQVTQLGQTAGTIDYPELGCGGTLTYLGASAGGGAALQEHLTYGGFRCIDNGTNTLTPIRSAGISFIWNHPDHRRLMVYGRLAPG